MRARCLVIVAILGATAWAAPAEAGIPGIQVGYYTPQFYLDYLVFYDQDGKPVYYENDTAYLVPSEYAGHDALVTHFQENTEAFSRWFQEVGHANLSYRLPLAHNGYQPHYYLGFPVFYDGVGLPIYYSAGTGYRVPSTAPGYSGYVRHYRQRRVAYLKWYRERGLMFRWYRQPVHTAYYQPLYHDGYLVYYDDAALPYYFTGGRMAYVPRTDALYNAYISHYQANHASYARWYRSGGSGYRAYRQPVLHKWQLATGAPRATGGRAVSRTFTPSAGALLQADRRSSPIARPERRPQSITAVERRPGARPEQRREPAARPARSYVNCDEEPRHSSCQGRGTHQPQAGPRPPVNRRGNPGRRR